MKKSIVLSILTLVAFHANAMDVSITFQPDASTLAAAASAAVSAASPVGSISMFGGSTPPAGWKIADGSSLLISAYPALYAAIGITYNVAGQDAAHFNLPNTQGVFVRSAGTQTLNSKSFSSSLGAASKDLTAKNGIYDLGHAHTFKSKSATTGGNLIQNTGVYDTGATTVDVGYANIVSGDAETKPASLTVNYIVRVN